MKQYIGKTMNGKEQKVVDEMLSRLTDFGSMKKIRDKIITFLLCLNLL